MTHPPTPGLETDDEAAFLGLADASRKAVGLDLRLYRSAQLIRRLGYFRERHGVADNRALAERLERDPVLAAKFADHLTINVTEFFRDPERFGHLRTVVIPELCAGGGAVRAWSAGCSTGAEAYSLAMLLLEAAPTAAHQVIATDIDDRMLAKATAAEYPHDETRGVPPELARRYLRVAPGGVGIAPEVRRLVRVRRHNLLTDPAPADFDLVVCRNVVIYFTAEAKAGLYDRVVGAMRRGGYLFVGATETLFQCRERGLEHTSPCFYRKTVEVRAGVEGGAT